MSIKRKSFEEISIPTPVKYSDCSSKYSGLNVFKIVKFVLKDCFS